MENYDVAIIGGGIAGCAIARELARYDLRLAVCEAMNDVGAGSTKANGGMVHSGYDPKPGSLKAMLNVEGCLAYGTWAEELGFHFRRPGSLVLGFGEEDLAPLRQLEAQARQNGLSGVSIISGQAIRNLEPLASPKAIYALHSPHTGEVDPFEVAVACAENAVHNGAALFLSSPVTGIARQDGGFVITMPGRVIQARFIVNAAGIYADEVARMAGADEYSIVTRHGDMIIMDKECGIRLNMCLYPIPTPVSKGVIVTTSVSGNIVLSATSAMREKGDFDSYRSGMDELLQGALRLVPDLNIRKVIRPYGGERAVVEDYDNDFYIKPAAKVPGFFHVAGIQSPGVAAAPGIARYTVDMLVEGGLKLRPRASYHPIRKAPIRFAGLSDAERNELIGQDSAWGRIVCRCETVTEAEIVAAARSNPPARSLDAVKRRTRAGAGRCQSGFCQYKVIHILARELGVKPEDICQEDVGSHVLFGHIKEGC